LGLSFITGEIIYMGQEHKRRNQVSMLARVDTKMPSTLNTTESLDGRLNIKMARFDAFWGPLHRLREAITQKIENFTHCMRHNHKHEGHRAQHCFISAPWARMDREIAFFLTTDDTCLCGETVLATEMYRVNCPCRHRFGAYCQNHLGVDRPERARNPRGPSVPHLPQMVLRVIQDWTQCEFRIVVVDRVVFAPGNSFRQGEVEQLAKLVVRDAHAQARWDEVRLFVEEKLVESDDFALGYSASFLDVH
jgi:hypothetical protein